MSKLLLVLSMLLSSNMAFSQPIPTLEKNWSGFSTSTLSDVSKKPFTTENFTVSATMTILSQNGRHIQFVYKAADGIYMQIGTLSADGKTLQFVYKGGSGVFNINGQTMTGCGAGIHRKYLVKTVSEAWCDEYTVSK